MESGQDKSQAVKNGSATGDSLAIALAQKIEDAAGGQSNWNMVHGLSFQFFKSRRWYWDKANNRYRVESLKRDYRIAGTVHGADTKLWVNGRLESSPDSLRAYGQLAYEAWINDTYWLILPFKLLDPGVHLRYLGITDIDSTTKLPCLELTFDQVGVTPENKYHVFFDTSAYRIVYWQFFEHATDTLPDLSNAWDDYHSYGKIELSGGRGDRSLKDIAVYDRLPDLLFTDVSLPASDLLSSH